jgi:hypothetical protein
MKPPHSEVASAAVSSMRNRTAKPLMSARHGLPQAQKTPYHGMLPLDAINTNPYFCLREGCRHYLKFISASDVTMCSNSSP